MTTYDEFRGVVFTDANHGWATSIKIVGYDWREKPNEWKGSIWHTNDGGQTWTRQIVPNSAGILNRIEFIDSENGWAVGIKLVGYNTFDDPQHVGVVYHTSNGGETWEEQYSPELDIVFTGVDFVDAKNGWVVGFKGRSSIEGGTVFHTTDGGITWERQEPSYTMWDVHFLNSNKGYAVGCMYGAAWGPPVLRTLDGGATWETVRMDRHDGEGLYGVAVVRDHIIAVGDHDFLGKSTRAWDSCDWVFPEPSCFNCDCLFEQFYINVHYRFEDVFFADENDGWVVGKRSFKPALWGQIILHTLDGGLTWETQYEHAPPDTLFSYFRLDSVYFTDSQNGWAVGSSESFYDEDGRREHRGAILHTTNSGLNWEEQASELYEFRDREFFAVQFLDSQNGWALAEGRFPDDTIFLAHTTDGGINWVWVDTGIEGSMGVGFALVQGDLVFTDEQHGWAAGGRGKTVVHTEDGGVNWVRQELPSVSRLFAVEFIDNQVGWIAGQELFHTIDGGAAWIKQDTGIGVDFQDIQFADSLNGWLAGNSGVMMYTNNSGNSWNRIANATSSNLRGISFVSPQKGWAVGDQGTIIAIYSPLTSEGDFDNDGLSDKWEQDYFDGLSQDDSTDYDGDELTNLEEYQNNTDPTSNDTDGDDMPDGWEVRHNLNPVADDASGDGDRDGLSNLEEFQDGYDPSIAATVINSITASPDIGEVPLDVVFTAASSDGITDWLWEFGDSATSNDQNPTHTYSQVGTFTVTLRAAGPGGPATIATNVISKNARPVANAGPDQAIGEGEQVILSGRHSHDPNDVVTSYQWAQVDGPAVSLSNADTAQVFFTAPAVGHNRVALTFQLTVTDSGWLQDTDTVIANVSWENEPPTADAGPGQTVFWGTAVTLNGSNSYDLVDGIKSYSWKQIAGNQIVTMSDTTAVKPTFTFPDVNAKGVSLVFELTVTDSGRIQDVDTVIINVSWEKKTGDIDGSGVIDLRDVILAIKVCARMNSYSPVFNEADMNGDGKIGLEEALYALQIVAELRPQ